MQNNNSNNGDNLHEIHYHQNQLDTGSAGSFRRISATSDLLTEDMREIQERRERNNANVNPAAAHRTSSLKVNLEHLTHDILRRAFSGPEKSGMKHDK